MATSPLARPNAPVRPSRKAGTALALTGLSLGYFMVLLDTTVLSVALPALHAAFGGGIDGLQWVVNAYTVVFAGLLLSMGALADRFGAKRLYCGGLVLFAAASALSAAATALGALIALRALLGIAGAALYPPSLALIAQLYPDAKRRARAVGVWASVTGAALAVGPVAGGLLVDAFGWRSIFLVNVPIALASLVLTARLVPEAPLRNRPRPPLHLPGQLAAILAIGSLSYALIVCGQDGPAAPAAAIAFAVALAAGGAFGYAERRSRAPLLPPALLRIPTLSAGLFAGLAIGFGLAAVLFLLPLGFEQLRGWSARASGLALLPLTLPAVVGPPFTAKLAARVGPRAPMAIGFGLAAAGALTEAAFGVAAGSPYAATAAALLLIGAGIPFVLPPLVGAVIVAAPAGLSGTASGVLNAVRQVGGSLGVAVAGGFVAGSAGTEAFADGSRLALLATAALLAAGGVAALRWFGTRGSG